MILSSMCWNTQNRKGTNSSDTVPTANERLLQLLPDAIGISFPIKVRMLLASTKSLTTGNKNNFVRIGILAHVMANVGTHVEIGARLAGMVIKLMCSAFSSLEKQDVSLSDRLKTSRSA